MDLTKELQDNETSGDLGTTNSHSTSSATRQTEDISPTQHRSDQVDRQGKETP